MKSKIIDSVDKSIAAITSIREPHALQFIEKASKSLISCFKSGNKLLIAGNGGSLCDALHCAEEFTGIFRSRERRALPAIALADPGHLSCIANDIGYEKVFSRSIEALGNEGDFFIALTTSGNSANLIEAIITAHQRKMHSIAFLGKTGGKLRGMAHLEWIVTAPLESDKIQEAHMSALHIIVEMVEDGLSSATS